VEETARIRSAIKRLPGGGEETFCRARGLVYQNRMQGGGYDCVIRVRQRTGAQDRGFPVTGTSKDLKSEVVVGENGGN